MKNFPSFLPVVLFTGIFIFSCNAASESNYDRDQGPNKIIQNNSPSSSADSLSNSGSGYDQIRLEDAKSPVQEKNTNFADVAAGNNVSAIQNEIANPQYQNFLYLMQSTAARPTRLDSTHRFIRTAELKFRAKNVALSSYRIEDLAVKFKGYVADTKLESQLQSSYEKPVSADSMLQTMRYVVVNTIVLRIPVENLDTTLKSIVPMIDYLDYRNVNTNDITLEMLSNKLAQARIFNYNRRLALDIDNKGKKLDDVQSAEQSILNQQENSDNALIENLRKDDQVKYSTVTIHIYQKETIRQELVAREKDVDEYEPGMGSKLAQSFSSGWHGLQVIIMGIVILWPLWLIAFGTWMLIRFLLRRSKKLKGN